MAEKDFYEIVEIAKKIEREKLPYSPFEGKVEVVKALEFCPREYTHLDFHDLLNYYKRIEKVMKASNLDVYSQVAEGEGGGAETTTPVEGITPTETGREEEIKEKAKTEEIETRVKEMTAVSIENAESIKSAESIEEIEKKMRSKEKETAPEKEIEYGPLEFERHEEQRVQPQFPVQPLEKKESEIKVLPAEAQVDETKPKPTVHVSPQEAASAKYQQIEDNFRREWEGEIDEQKIKKKMLELTKELFKEKSVRGRERIKGKIVVLKGILSKITTKKKKRAGREAGYTPAFFESIVETQNTELSNIKDEIVTKTKSEMNEIKKRFQETLAVHEDMPEEEKKKAYEKFVFDLTSLSEQLNGIVAKHEEFIAQKHISEIEQFISKLPEDNKKLADSAKKRIESIKESYKKELETIKKILVKEIETMIDQTGKTVFREEGEKVKEEEIAQVLFEINEMDEATLLYFLHIKKPEVYKRYERKHLSKHEAIHYAKILMAKEKGLSDDTITKYFGQISRIDDK